MTDNDKLTLLKALVDITGNDQDAALEAYLSLAGDKILTGLYPYDETRDAVPARYASLQCEIAAYLWQKRGAEGQTSHSENGITRGYGSADVPQEMLAALVPYVGIV